MEGPEADEREVLASLIENYERIHHPLADEIRAKAFPEYIKELGFSTKGLMPIMGNRHRVSEILHGRRGLSISMVFELRRQLGVPYEILMAWTGPAMKLSQDDEDSRQSA